MPELPEVETVCRGLSRALAGRRIEAVTLHRKDLRIPFPARLPDVAGARVEGVSRRAKYILLKLDNAETMVVHLGMSGRMVVKGREEGYDREKHDHMLLQMQDGTRVVFNDARRFGLVDLVVTNDLEKHKLFRHLGPEPLERSFDAPYLAGRLKDKKVAIKLAIMDQAVVVGVGNIYASEALFRAGIDPRRRARSLKKPEIAKLVAAIKAVLQAAIKAGGSSLRDYVQADGELGYFQHRWAVYDKQGQKCKGCSCDIKKTGGIRKITQGQRSTFYCPQKQK
ncbi:MAG: bifunctional DNA-formamidopyrimidine glycosylase/DNA-(apurinic or apyrimidinic site) lyase [Alphaproteobacteria bacterium]|nr:MAG: bifunctional DNA-formamidopyrimidine glycosylase/DNA-(apurinic or apyrimidinic site) lyase [Alphaproteobacteria bacterium]